MKPYLALSLAAALTTFANAGEVAKKVIVPTEEPRTMTFAEFEAAYGGEADFKEGGSGSVWEGRIRAGVIIPWVNTPLPGRDRGQWQIRLGVDYHRFEFDNEATRSLPDRLQSVSAIIGLEYKYDSQIAFLLEARPGVFVENDVTSDSFDVPIRFGMGYRVNDHFSLALMARYNGFAKYPVIGGVGFVWKINDSWTLSALLPEPRLTYKASDEWSFWLGGEWAGGGYRTDNSNDRRKKLRGAVVDYTDYRAAIGTTWMRGSWRLEAAVGASLQREFEYHRADETIRTDDPAPFVKLSAGVVF
jgi:hypothetical protein